MGFFSKLFRKQIEYEPLMEEEEVNESWEGGKNVDLSDSMKRINYVETCLEQMAEASSEIERLKDEYEVVNSYLRDMEEIEALPDVEKENVEAHAKIIESLNLTKKNFKEKTLQLSESDYKKMERMEDTVVEGIKSLKEAESYQDKIRVDLQRLEGEKHACKFRMDEANTALMNLRGMSVICIVAGVSCVLILLILQFALHLDARIGYMIMAVGLALILTIFYVRYKETDKELHSASRSYNKVIMLQNKVKIRYVNNTSLLEYLYLKFHIGSAAKLQDLWDKYLIEKDERQKLKETEEDLDFHSEQLVKQLKNYNLYDPMIWIHQTEALLNPKEMVEVRHNLILRRQSLRKQMEYNNTVAEQIKAEIMDVVKKYPRDAETVLHMVEKFDSTTLA